MPAHIPIVGDMNKVFTSLSEQTDYHVSKEWASIVDDLKHEPRRVSSYRVEGYVEPRAFIRSFSAMMQAEAILAADVGQNQIWCGQQL